MMSMSEYGASSLRPYPPNAYQTTVLDPSSHRLVAETPHRVAIPTDDQSVHQFRQCGHDLEARGSRQQAPLDRLPLLAESRAGRLRLGVPKKADRYVVIRA